MSQKTYKCFDLAESQLEAAIGLFITGGDKFSVITLAGAVDVIFTQLVTRNSKENFTELLLRKENNSRTKQELGKEVNDTLHINTLKHFDPGDEECVSLDVEACALGAILKAIVNYQRLEERNKGLIAGFFYWVKTNIDLDKYTLLDCTTSP